MISLILSLIASILTVFCIRIEIKEATSKLYKGMTNQPYMWKDNGIQTFFCLLTAVLWVLAYHW